MNTYELMIYHRYKTTTNKWLSWKWSDINFYQVMFVISKYDLQKRNVRDDLVRNSGDRKKFWKTLKERSDQIDEKLKKDYKNPYDKESALIDQELNEFIKKEYLMELPTPSKSIN